MTTRRYTLAFLADRVAGRVVGDATLEVSGLASLATAKPGTITHLSSSRYSKHLAATRASAVILAEADVAACPAAAIVVPNPYLAFARISRLFDETPSVSDGIHRTAHIDQTAQIGAGARIGPNVVIAQGVRVGERVSVGANAVIAAHCTLGDDVDIRSNVVIYHRVTIGSRTVIHSGAVIGADGFGFTPDERGRLEAIAQVGGVTIGEDVSIGAATTIDRGAIDDTVVGTGVKIDNQVQIAHNCVIGDHTVICGCVGMAGSTKIGRHCVLAGAVGIAGDGPIEITDRVVVGAMTHVARSIDRPGVYSGGIPASDNRRWRRNALRFGELDEISKRLTRIERRLREAAPGD